MGKVGMFWALSAPENRKCMRYRYWTTFQFAQ